MLIRKVTTGSVVQVFDTDRQAFVSQEFISGDQVTYETEGDEVNVTDFEDRVVGTPSYLAFDMVQP